MEKENAESISPAQERLLIQAIPNISKIVSRKLGAKHRDSVEDIRQRVLLKLWRWKTTHEESNLSGEEWRKLATVVAQNEVVDFFREKYARDVPFSQMDQLMEEKVASVRSEEIIEGNSRAEICSLLYLVWKAAQKLTPRQKYAYFLQYSDFVVEFIACGCCSIEELRNYFNFTEKEFPEIIDSLPFADEKIGILLEDKLGEKITPKQLWEARAKAKAKLATRLKDFIFDERLPV